MEDTLSFAAAFVAGLFSVATPCVFPMVTITLGVLGVSNAPTRSRAFLIASCYVAGIIATFTALGVVSGLAGGVFGAWLGHPVTAIAMAAVFVILAGNAFGLYEFGLPGRLATSLSRTGGAGPAGAFAAGLVAGIIAAPCIGPVVVAILAYVTASQDALYGAALLATYGLGFGLPFLAVGTLAIKLPKSGPWMTAVKGIFGILLLVGAFWFLRGAIPVLRGPAWMAGGIACLAVGAVSFIILASRRSPPSGHRFLKPAGVVVAVAGGILALNALLATPAGLRWCESGPDHSCLPEACQGKNRTVVVFAAEWCGYCQELESTTFADPRVIARLQRFGLVHVDIDRNPEMARRADVRGVPAIFFLDAECRPFAKIGGYVDADDFLRALDEVEASDHAGP